MSVDPIDAVEEVMIDDFHKRHHHHPEPVTAIWVFEKDGENHIAYEPVPGATEYTDIDPDTNFPYSWEDDAAYFIMINFLANPEEGYVNTPENNWAQGIMQLQAGVWKKIWGTE